jgi:hypothetical protein
MAHGHTILAPVLRMPPRSHLESLDKEHGPGRQSRVLSRWSPFGALIFAPRAGRHSLRDVVHCLAAQAGALAPLGLTPPQRSTLAEANNRRPATRYHTLVLTRYARGQAVAPGHGFRFKNPLFSLASTTRSRGLSLFPGAPFRTATGAMKLHTLLDHAGHIPACGVITAGTRSDIALARGRPLPKGSIVALARGDIEDRVLFRLTQDGVFFVPRQQVKAKVKVTKRVEGDWQRGLTSDHPVVWLGQGGKTYPEVRRRVGYRDPATCKPYVFWTHAFPLAAATMTAIDTHRWPSELFLKAMKQALRIKTFLGTSANAVMTQVWVALITSLLLAFLRFKAGWGLAFPPLLRRLQMHLFDQRNLGDLCHLQTGDITGRPLVWAISA